MKHTERIYICKYGLISTIAGQLPALLVVRIDLPIDNLKPLLTIYCVLSGWLSTPTRHPSGPRSPGLYPMVASLFPPHGPETTARALQLIFFYPCALFSALCLKPLVPLPWEMPFPCNIFALTFLLFLLPFSVLTPSELLAQMSLVTSL